MASLYTLQDNGLQLDSTQINNLTHTSQNVRGFFRTIDLQLLLSKIGCVGLRFYNVTPPNGTPSIIASAAKEDGFEFVDLYLQSHDPGGVNLNMMAIQLNRQTASDRANFPPQSTQFMSYFSKNDILTRLMNGPETGIAFYEVTLANVADTDFHTSQTDFIKNNKTTIRTHIAIPTQLNNGELLSSENLGNNVQSIHPCPGHCLVEDNSGQNENRVEGRAELKFVSSANDPYLFRWEV